MVESKMAKAQIVWWTLSGPGRKFSSLRGVINYVESKGHGSLSTDFGNRGKWGIEVTVTISQPRRPQGQGL